MGARPPIIFGGLKTTHCALGGDAWRMTQKNYFMLVCWLWHCAATAVALQVHEGVNAFNLVNCLYSSRVVELLDFYRTNASWTPVQHWMYSEREKIN